MNRLAWIAVVVVVIAAVGWYAYDRWGGLLMRSDQVPVTEPSTVPPSVDDEPPQIRHPVPAPTPEDEASDNPPPDQAPPPSLEESDEPLREDLAGLAGERPVEAFLVPEDVVRRLVVAVDNLDGDPPRLSQWPVEHVAEPLAVAVENPGTDNERITLSPDNAQRYAPYVTVLEKVDAEALAGLYYRYYPLFQQAYERLGYPDHYFNDRLIEIIDHLLATPQVERPIELRQPEVLYVFADPKLEALSWGQKTLIRMGPEQAATVKEKLREIRERIAAQPDNTN